MNIELGPHERLDDLVLDGMKVIQRDDQFCFSLDTVLLAHFGAVPHGPALDLGTGTAAIPLILTARGAKALTAVEFNPVMADIARRNVALNGRDDRITIVEGDYRRIREWAASGAFAAVYANPPYREKSRGAYSDVDGIRRLDSALQALHQPRHRSAGQSDTVLTDRREADVGQPRHRHRLRAALQQPVGPHRHRDRGLGAAFRRSIPAVLLVHQHSLRLACVCHHRR